MSLEFRAVSHSYDGAAPVLSDVTLAAKAGKITCLLGPSGCGKTTLMKLAAGILPLQHGIISLQGQTLAEPKRSPPPEQRPVGVVFQEGALFAHMTVAQNIGFGLPRSAKKDQKINALLDQVGLSNFADRYPHMLSGGQQQRVALARALAPQPSVLLLDEPFANIDIQLRKVLRQQTRAMLKDTQRVVMLVTHDPEEALEMADEIAVLSRGSVLQAGPPQRLYDAPTNLAVATLIGEAQPLTGTLLDSGIETVFGRWPVSALRGEQQPAGPANIAVRAEDLMLEPCDSGSLVTDYRLLRGQHCYTLEASGVRLTAVMQMSAGLSIGDNARCVARDGSVFAFPAAQ